MGRWRGNETVRTLVVIAGLGALVALSALTTYPASTVGASTRAWTLDTPARIASDIAFVATTGGSGKWAVAYPHHDGDGILGWFLCGNYAIAPGASGTERSPGYLANEAAIRGVLDASGITRDLIGVGYGTDAVSGGGKWHAVPASLRVELAAVQALVWHYATGVVWNRSATVIFNGWTPPGSTAPLVADIWARYDALATIGDAAPPRPVASATISGLAATAQAGAPVVFDVSGTASEDLEVTSSAGPVYRLDASGYCDTTAPEANVPESGGTRCVVPAAAGAVTLDASARMTDVDQIVLGSEGKQPMVGVRDNVVTASAASATIDVTPAPTTTTTAPTAGSTTTTLAESVTSTTEPVGTAPSTSGPNTTTTAVLSIVPTTIAGSREAQSLVTSPPPTTAPARVESAQANRSDSTSSDSTLAFTGANSLVVVLAALASILMGIGMVLNQRRNR